MRKKFFIAIVIVLFAGISLFFSRQVFSLECEQLSGQPKIDCLNKKLSELGQTANTLTSEIQRMDTQISLTTSRIQQTEDKIIDTQKEIDILGTRIEGLDTSLDYLSKLLVQRIADGYKKRNVSFFTVILDSINAADLFDRIKYMKTAQDNNQKILVQVQETKLNFEEQKKLREEKKIELNDLEITLNNQKLELNNQRFSKQKFLETTRGEESVYQGLLAQARAEYAAIQGIITGAGSETKLRDVSKGDVIAYEIRGASCNSSGGHVHFIVQDNGTVQNPFSYLKSAYSLNCSGSSCGSTDGDLFNPTGSWDWPLSPQIELEQGYGETWAVRNTWVGRIYRFHNGLDINGSSNNVLAVSNGTLYQGGYAVGCTLPYVKLVHKDSNIVTYYLHVYAN